MSVASLEIAEGGAKGPGYEGGNIATAGVFDVWR